MFSEGDLVIYDPTYDLPTDSSWAERRGEVFYLYKIEPSYITPKSLIYWVTELKFVNTPIQLIPKHKRYNFYDTALKLHKRKEPDWEV